MMSFCFILIFGAFGGLSFVIAVFPWYLHIYLILATSAENVSLSMRNMHRFRLIQTCTKSRPSICTPLIHSIMLNDSISGQRML